MVCVVYVDVLFLLNFIVNYLILFASAHIAGAPIHRFRIAAAGAIGAIYGVVAFFESMRVLTMLWAKILVAVIMVVTAFGIKTYKRLLRYFLIFCGISFAFGGAVFAIYTISNGAGGLMDVRNGVFYLKVPLGVLLASSAICYLIFAFVFRRTAHGAATEHVIREVELSLGARTTAFRALVDSGNTLCDPLTNIPVIIVEYSAARDVLPHDARAVLDGISGDEFSLAITKLPASMRFRLMPYKTIDSALGMLLAFKPDMLIIDKVEKKNMLVAISPNVISDGGAYCALTGIGETL
ncbi:MAG: sigma-E processing peptidase SpoIIGA [Clostridia bacterium]